MELKVSLTSLGCSKNLVDSERILANLKKSGYKLVVEPGDSDIAIVNTCGFIQSAKEEAIETILELVTLKNEGTIKKIIITGCLAERYNETASELFPEVDAVVGLGSESDITDIIEKIMKDERVNKFEDKTLLPLTGDRIISTLPFFAYLKIAEGCSNCCSYCAIPSIRGRFRSVPMESVLQEARWLAENGVTEIVVIAQDSTRYGEDLYGKSELPKLLRKLCEINEFKWIRVLYCYPERITDELIDVFEEEEKIVKYFEIPIQHCDDDILKAMNRQSSYNQLKQLFSKIRARIPEAVIRTTLITGFPSETDEQFEKLAEFVKEMQFDRLGCFPYSEEENTKAAEMENQIDEEVRQKRADIIMQQQQLISEQKNNTKINSVVEAVTEGFDKWAECYFGRTKADAPDIDGKIFFTSDRPLKIGEYVNVLVTDTLDYDLLGETC